MNSRNWHFPEALQNGEFPFLDLIGVEIKEIDEGKAVIQLNVNQKHLRSLGIVHGGVTSTLLDTALGVAGASYAPDGHHAVTMQLNINFTRIASQGDLLTSIGRVLHRGSRTAVCQGEVIDQNEAIIATATSTIMFLPLPK